MITDILSAPAFVPLAGSFIVGSFALLAARVNNGVEKAKSTRSRVDILEGRLLDYERMSEDARRHNVDCDSERLKQQGEINALAIEVARRDARIEDLERAMAGRIMPDLRTGWGEMA